MRNYFYKTCKYHRAFSLAEILAALTISAMILVAVLGIYSRAERTATAVTNRLDSSRLAYELLQRIAEDIDRMAGTNSDTKIIIDNKFEKGQPIARLEILKTIYNNKNKKQTLEAVVWQSGYDYDNENNGLVLYRSRRGIGPEDKLLDAVKEDWERELFVPMCAGVTFIKVRIPVGEDFQERWTSDSLPKAVAVTISFAEPFKKTDGTWDVPDSEKLTRTINVDGTRKIGFTIKKEDDEKAE